VSPGFSADARDAYPASVSAYTCVSIEAEFGADRCHERSGDAALPRDTAVAPLPPLRVGEQLGYGERTSGIGREERTMTVKLRLYKRGGWEVDIQLVGPDGRSLRLRRKAPTKSKSEAKRWGDALERHEMSRLIAPAPASGKEVPTVSDFAPRYLDGYVKANRQKDSSVAAVEQILQNHIVPLLGDLRLDQVDDEQQQKLKTQLRHLKEKTVNNVLAVLSGMMTVAVDWKVIPAKPFRLKLLRVPPPVIDFYDFSQLDSLLEAAGKIDPRVRAVVLLGAHAGARRGEMISLRWHNINFDANKVTFELADWQGIESCSKSRRYRVVPMTKALAEALRACRHLRGARVLYDDDGKPLTAVVVR